MGVFKWFLRGLKIEIVIARRHDEAICLLVTPIYEIAFPKKSGQAVPRNDRTFMRLVENFSMFKNPIKKPLNIAI